MKAKCDHCEKPFDRKRRDQKYCSSNCRSKASMMRGLNGPGLPGNSLTSFNPGSGGDEFKQYLQQENLHLKTELQKATAELTQLRTDNLNLKVEAKTDKKLAELDKAQSKAEKDRGLSGFVDSLGGGERLLDMVEGIVEKVFSGKGGDSILAGLEGKHKEHIETLVNALRTDPEFAILVTAVALKCKKDPSILKEFVQYLNNPDLANAGNVDTEEEENEQPAPNTGMSGMADLYANT
jgi:hypothetical protein